MFEFNGIDATTYGTVTKEPIRKRPEQDTRITKVEGADTSIREATGFRPYVIETQMVLFDTTDLDDIYTWLNGEGDLILDDHPERVIVAYCDASLEPERFSRGVSNRVIDIQFLILSPYWYEDNETPIVLTVAGNVTNEGNFDSRPVLKITGSGTVTVTVDGRSFTYIFDTPFVIVDSLQQDAYHDGVLKNRRMTGDFPILEPGINAISWTGTVTSIELTKVSRWL
jgi:phage-related protein